MENRLDIRLLYACRGQQLSIVFPSMLADPMLDAIQELDEDVLAEQYEEYQRGQHSQSTSDPNSNAGAERQRQRQRQIFENEGGGMEVDAPPVEHRYGPSDAEEDEYGMDDSAVYELIAQEEEERSWQGY